MLQTEYFQFIAVELITFLNSKNPVLKLKHRS